MKGNNNRIFVVLGMHRSGTSVCARGLKALGVRLGDNLLPAGNENPKGFWEDLEILEINEALLASIGIRWDSVRIINDSDLKTKYTQQLTARAVCYINKKFSKSSLWGFKEPRTCRLMPFWHAVFNELKLDDSYVIAFRNPLSVAQSLAERNQFSPEKSYILWLEHVLSAATSTNGKHRVFVNYDSLIESPEKQLYMIAKKLDIPLSTSVKKNIEEYANEFVSPEFRHSEYSFEDLTRDENLIDLVEDLFEILVDITIDNIPETKLDEYEPFINIKNRIFALKPIFNHMDDLENRLVLEGKAKEEIAIREIEWRNKWSVQESEYTNLVRSLENTKCTLDKIETENQANLSRLKDILSKHEREKLNAEQRARELAETKQDMAELVADRNAILSKVEIIEEELHQAHQDLSKHCKEIDQLNSKLREKNIQFEQQRREIGSILDSTSWKLTKPLRFIRKTVNKWF